MTKIQRSLLSIEIWLPDNSSQNNKRSVLIKIQDMEELRRAIFDSIDIGTERNYNVIDQFTKLEIQAKIMGLGIIASESILTVLQMSKQEIIKFILQLNLHYVTEEESIEDVPNTMNDTRLPVQRQEC